MVINHAFCCMIEVTIQLRSTKCVYRQLVISNLPQLPIIRSKIFYLAQAE